MASPKVTLGGYTVLGSSTVRWRLRPGVAPTIETFDLIPADADALLAGRGSAIDLVIEGAGETQVIRSLYAIERAPADDPFTGRVAVADRRIWWTYPHVFRRYNVRRRVGVKGLGDPAVPELQPLPDDIWYAPWSTFDGDGAQPWTARQVLTDVLEAVLARELEVSGQAAPYRIEETSFGALTDLPIEGLYLDMSGAAALQAALTELPQATVRVDADGTVVVYSLVSGREAAILDDAGAETVDQGHVEFIRHARTRPSLIRVYYSREVELRLDAEELAAGATTSRDPDGRFMENVLPLPDHSLVVNGRTLYRGTWITIAQVLAAWGPIPGVGSIDLQFLRRGMVPYVDAWAAARLSGEASPDVDWVARISALTQHYRQTYRVNPRWMDRLHSIRAQRVAIIDPETGTKAPSVAFCNYSRLPSQRRIDAGATNSYMLNVAGYPTGGILDENARPAPARVSILDSDQGIVRVDFLPDVVGFYHLTLPGRIAMSQSGLPGPSPRLRDADRVAVTFDALPETAAEDIPELETPWRLATVITALAGAPNDLRQLHRVDITPDDIATMLPPALRAGLAESFGPPLDIRVGAGPATTALVGWKDDFAEQIDAALGLTGTPDENVDLTPITINAGSPDAPVDAIARGLAAGIYATYSDRWQGGKTVKIKSDVRLEGWLGEVSYEVSTGGEVVTRLSLRDGGPSIDLYSLLPPSVRALMMRLAQPGGAA